MSSSDLDPALDPARDDPALADPAPDVPHVLVRGFRLIGRSLRIMPGSHAIAITGAVAFAFAAVALTRVFAWITDEVIVPGLDQGMVSGNRLLAGVAAIMAVGLVRGAGAVVRRYYLGRARFGTELRWRRELFRHYLEQPLSFHEQRPTGELLAHADADLQAATIVLMPFAFSVAAVVLAVLALVSLLLIHPLLALIAVVLFPALAALNHVYTRLVEPPAARAQQLVGDVSSVAHESFDGVLVVKTLGREEAEVERLAVVSDALRRQRIAIGRMRAVFEPAIDALPNAGIVGLLALGAWLVSRQSITVGDLVGAMALFTILALPMRIVGFFLEEMPKSVVALDRIDRVLSQPLPSDSRAGRALPDEPLDVGFDSVHAGYGDAPVLEGVSFAVAPGEAVAVVGATGAGKTTLAKLLVDLRRPDAGSVRIGGLDVHDISHRDLARSIALVFQETFLFADTIAENVRLGRAIDDAAVAEALRVAGADEFVAQMPRGVETVVGERGITLSGGQRQRIALARAIAGEPRVLFLDDATSAVDPVVEARVLRNLRDELHLTMLIVAHRLSTITSADRVVFLADGRVAGIGRHDELMAMPAYAALARAYEAEEAA